MHGGSPHSFHGSSEAFNTLFARKIELLVSEFWPGGGSLAEGRFFRTIRKRHLLDFEGVAAISNRF